MNEIYIFAFRVCVILIIMALLSILTEHSKNGRLVRSVISVLLIVAVIRFVTNVRFDAFFSDVTADYSVDTGEVWQKTLCNVEQQFSAQMLSLCRQNGLTVDDIKVTLRRQADQIITDDVTISGRDARTAKNLIAGYFQISLAYININGEENNG